MDKKTVANQLTATIQELAQKEIAEIVKQHPQFLIYVQVAVSVMTTEEYAAAIKAASQPARPAPDWKLN